MLTLFNDRHMKWRNPRPMRSWWKPKHCQTRKMPQPARRRQALQWQAHLLPALPLQARSCRLSRL